MKEILQTLADKISRKSVLLMTAMILIYMIVIAPTVIHPIIAIAVIGTLSVIGVILQFIIDCKKGPKEKVPKDKPDKK